MTDNDFLLAVLTDGGWHSRDEIIQKSQQHRGFGLTVHSRAADLRKRGHVVETTQERDERGRVISYYRLGVLDEAVDSVAGVRDATRSTAVSSSTPPNPAIGGVLPSFSAAPSSEPQSRDEGVLAIFECSIDESAGVRGAYWDDAA